MAIQREQIIQTAIAILDRDGLEGVTLRRLATELNIKAASIYWHIPSKEVLLDEMANAILAERFGSLDFANDQRDWAEWLTTLARELRAAMLGHREGARVVAGAHLGITVMLSKLNDLSVRVLHYAGFTGTIPVTITVTVTTFTFGFVIEEQASPPLSNPPPSQSIKPFPPTDVSSIASEALALWMAEDYDAHFDTSLRILINGVRAELDAPRP